MCVRGFVVQVEVLVGRVRESQRGAAVVEAREIHQAELVQEGPAPVGGGLHGCTTWND